LLFLYLVRLILFGALALMRVVMRSVRLASKSGGGQAERKSEQQKVDASLFHGLTGEIDLRQ
jgi:hypothetical protein